jgi:hypothetical protein
MRTADGAYDGEAVYDACRWLSRRPLSMKPSMFFQYGLQVPPAGGNRLLSLDWMHFEYHGERGFPFFLFRRE